MEDAVPNRKAASARGHRGIAATNSEHAVVYSDGEVYTLLLKDLDAEPHSLATRRLHKWRTPILSLSLTPSSLLAIAQGHEAYAFDLHSAQLKHVIPGVGRTITSLSLCTPNASLCASGHIDGSVCVWNLDDLDRPTDRLQSIGQSCDALEFSATDANCLASLHACQLHIRYLTGSRWQTVCILSGLGCSAFCWHPRRPGRLAVSTENEKLCIYDLSDTIKSASSASVSDDSDADSDGGVFEPADDITKDSQPVLKFDAGASLKSVSWVSDVALIGLVQNGAFGLLFSVGEDEQTITELWRCRLEQAAEAVQILQNEERMVLLGIGPEGVSFHDIPENVAEVMHLDAYFSARSAVPTASASHDFKRDTLVDHSANPTRSPSMSPLSIVSRRGETSAFAKTSRQLQISRRVFRFRNKPRSTPSKSESSVRSQVISTSPQSQGMHSEVDSAIFEAEDDFGSPMPFLSPGIPSTRILPHDIPLLNDNAITPPDLRKGPQDGSEISRLVTPTAGPDTDDSDDETFVDDMHGSAAFLPGGINVPLPKACGALFAPNGQLLTFFPPKAKPAIAQQERNSDRPAQKSGDNERTARLFPTFGNSELISASSDEDSDSENFDLLRDEDRRVDSMPRFVFQPASFPSQASWKAQNAAAHPTVYLEQPRHKIMVNVHEIADIPSPLAEQRTVARAYRLLCKNGESGPELCESNAAVAEAAGFDDIAEIWRLLAMLLSDRLPLSVLSSESARKDALANAREAMSLSRSDSGVDLPTRDRASGVTQKLDWIDHPFGGSWLVRRILAWAEDRADVLSLACFSAILSEAGYSSSKRSSAEQSMLTHLATYSYDHAKETSNDTPGIGGKKVIPILRTHSATITSLHESPTKALPSGELSSSLASQTSLNYSDSSATPPFASPLLSRQSTRLSASGASSPEFQRGSFSTAARYYAASFSEKFGYGTSPPVKKSDTSPTTSNELSSSLPGGSWPGKSVSFASTTTESSTQRSMSTSASKSNTFEDVGYDSDKTIEDTSLPYTSKSARNNVAVNLSKHNAFPDEICGMTRARLMPDELSSKIAIWNSYYAEQLRSWEMLDQASELEKVLGLTTGVQLGLASEPARHEGLLPKVGTKQRNTTCEICLVATKGLIQICPACSHSSHLKCLQDFCAELPEGEFACPSGCGCACADLPLLVQEIARQSPQRPTFKKKASFTDPRRWRARNEGDSW